MDGWVLRLLVQICADVSQLYEAGVVEEGGDGRRLQFGMMFLFKLQIGSADGWLMAPVAIVDKLPRVNLLAIASLKRLDALLKLTGIDAGKQMVSLILTLRIYVAECTFDGSALHAYQNILLIICF